MADRVRGARASAMMEPTRVPRRKGTDGVGLDGAARAAARTVPREPAVPAGPRDELLYQRARQGDAAAFAVLYERYRDPLFRFLWGWTGERLVAEDALQDAFLAVFTRGPAMARSFRFRPYLYRTALNRVVDLHRRAAREVPTMPGALSDLDHRSPTFTEAVDTMATLEQALAALTPAQRLAISLHYFADLPVKEVARLLGEPVGTVKTRLARSYPRLLAVLEGEKQP